MAGKYSSNLYSGASVSPNESASGSWQLVAFLPSCKREDKSEQIVSQLKSRAIELV